MFHLPDVRIDRHGLLNVLQLRDEFGGFQTPQDLPQLAAPAGGIYGLRNCRLALGGKGTDS